MEHRLDMGADECRVHVLASGSRGNATLVRFGQKGILIDAGISAKRLNEAMLSVGFDPYNLSAIFITHEHTDHMNGLPQLLKRFGRPVYTRKKTWQAMGEKLWPYEHLFTPITKKSILIDGIVVENFSISHDAANPVAYSCYKGKHKVTQITDTGFIDDYMLGHMDESTKLILESNHDLEMLKYGPYNWSLQQRVAGPRGHLNNVDAAQALSMVKRGVDFKVVLAHRSEQNNSISCVDQTMHHVLLSRNLEVGKDIIYSHADPKKIVTI